MLPRILEPEVMDSQQDALDYDTMDHSTVNRSFAEDLLSALGMPTRPDALADVEGDNSDEDEPNSLLALDLGTGTAQIPILVCEMSHELRIIAADASIAMLEQARLNVEISGLRERIQLDHVDAKNMPYRDGMFDVVMSNSIVHHIADPRSVLTEAVRIVRPGGLLFFRDLARPADGTALGQLVEQYAADCNPHQRQLFRDSLHAALTLEEMQSLVGGFGFERRSVALTSDRHWTWAARR